MLKADARATQPTMEMTKVRDAQQGLERRLIKLEEKLCDR